MIDGKADLLEACRSRKMKLIAKKRNLLETRVKAEGILDGMTVRLDMNCITGMPGESQGTFVLQGNLGQLLSVLARIWPTLEESRDAFSPGRQSWPDYERNPKSPKKRAPSAEHPEGN